MSKKPDKTDSEKSKNADQLRQEEREKRWEEEGKKRGRWQVLLVFVGIPITLWLLWTQILYPTYPARYELTIYVETPEGIKSGSSVIEARYGWEPTIFGLISGVRNSFSGEAVFVDLGDGKNLIVTLKDDLSKRKESLDVLYLPMRVFPFAPHHRVKTKQDIERAKRQGEVSVPLDRLPMLVTFRDINEPKSVERVDPGDLQATFGVGFAMQRATIEITDKPLEPKIAPKLPGLFGRHNTYKNCGELMKAIRLNLCWGDLRVGENRDD